MRMELELTRKQAEKIAYVLNSNGFHMYGRGNFDLTWEEEIKLIQLAFGKKAEDRCHEYYKQLQSRHMG